MNPYDDPTFFDQYAHMRRSEEGLKGAGEWPALEAMLPDLTDKKILDLGAGYGWHAKYFVDHGAASVVAVDLSEKMIATAKEKNGDPRITYMVGDISQVDFDVDQFDMVFSSLAIHYLPSFATLVDHVRKFLVPDGIFLFSVEHPVFTASGDQDFVQSGERTVFPVDRYFDEGKRETEFLGSQVTKYHRSLTTYLHTLVTHQFVIADVVEPTPAAELRNLPEMANEWRRPMMLIIKSLNHK
ncbi:class I SAM-dependent methyltransferase [Lacticaseibacillus saniviri]